MKTYNYIAESGIYHSEGLADESPLEPGVFLIPAYASTEEPPKFGDGEQAVWTGDGWLLQPIPEPEPVPEPEPELPPTPENIQALRLAAFQAEADPLYFEYRAGEGDETTWLAKREEIRARYPYAE